MPDFFLRKKIFICINVIEELWKQLFVYKGNGATFFHEHEVWGNHTSEKKVNFAYDYFAYDHFKNLKCDLLFLESICYRAILNNIK